MINEIAADIRVVAEFHQGRVQPRIFAWDRRRYDVTQINAAWSDRDGIWLIHRFSVQTAEGDNLYELEFHPGELRWRLLRIYTDG